MMSPRTWIRHVGPWFLAKAVIIILCVSTIILDARLNNVLTTQRPSQPKGDFTVPFQTHGGVTYISPAENMSNVTLLGCCVMLLLAYWSIERFEKRSRTR